MIVLIVKTDTPDDLDLNLDWSDWENCAQCMRLVFSMIFSGCSSHQMIFHIDNTDHWDLPIKRSPYERFARRSSCSKFGTIWRHLFVINNFSVIKYLVNQVKCFCHQLRSYCLLCQIYNSDCVMMKFSILCDKLIF